MGFVESFRQCKYSDSEARYIISVPLNLNCNTPAVTID